MSSHRRTSRSATHCTPTATAATKAAPCHGRTLDMVAKYRALTPIVTPSRCRWFLGWRDTLPPLLEVQDSHGRLPRRRPETLGSQTRRNLVALPEPRHHRLPDPALERGLLPDRDMRGAGEARALRHQ